MFGLMAGETIPPEMIGTPEYDEAVKNISAVSWIDENSPPTVCAYGAHDKVQAFPASKRLAAALEEHGVPTSTSSFPTRVTGSRTTTSCTRYTWTRCASTWTGTWGSEMKT